LHIRVRALTGGRRFAPATIPKRRRLQTLCVTLYSLSLVLSVALYLLLWCVPGRRARARAHLRRSYPPLWPALLAYTLWARYVDDAPEHGGRFSPWVRGCRFFKNWAGYYPASCVRTFWRGARGLTAR
jgi:2-acylglycerol O-acyltransferase 2